LFLFAKAGQELRGRNLLEWVTAATRTRWIRAAQRALEGAPVTIRSSGLGAGAGRSSVFNITIFRMPAGRLGEELGVLVQPAAHASPGPMIAQLLHDEVGQRLSAAGLELDLLRLDLAAIAPSAVDRIDRVQASLENIMDRIRELTRELQNQSKPQPLRKDADVLQCSPRR
jgi:hypothetical protein